MEFESSPRSASTSTSTTASVSFNLPPRKPSIHRQPYQHPFQVPKVKCYLKMSDLKLLHPCKRLLIYETSGAEIISHLDSLIK